MTHADAVKVKEYAQTYTDSVELDEEIDDIEEIVDDVLMEAGVDQQDHEARSLCREELRKT